VHTLDKFRLHVVVLMCSFQGEQLGSFLKTKCQVKLLLWVLFSVSASSLTSI